MKQLFTIASSVLMLMAVQSDCQTVYSGTIGKAAVEFVIGDVFDDSQHIEAVYLYEKYRDPISLNGGYYQNTLTFNESDRGKIVFRSYDPKKTSLEGIWTNVSTKKARKIVLTRKYDFDLYDTTESDWPRELLQPVSLNSYFFKIIVQEAAIIGIRILEKKTGALFQEIDGLECHYLRFRSVLVEDIKLDGKVGFQIYNGGQRETLEDGTSGPWMDMWLTFLFNSDKKKFIESGIEYK